MDTMEPNWLAAALAALAYYFLGALWFTPLFGRLWDRSIGFERPKGNRFPALYYVAPLISACVVSLVAVLLTTALGIDHLTGALLLGLTLGAGYAAVSVTNAVTPHTPKPLLLGAVTGGYHLVGAVLACTVIVALT